MTSLPALRHMVLVTAALAAGLTACQGCRSTTTAASPAASAEVGAPTLRLYLVSDLAGALEPCGCTRDQLGGLDHFGAWVKHEAAAAPASLVASAGPLFFMDAKLEGERADQDRIKADTMAKVLRGLSFAAFAPGDNDWDDGAQGFASRARASGATPVLADGQATIREVGGLRVGFIGFGRGGSEGGKPDVEDVVKRGVQDARRQGAEVLVALAAAGRGEAKRIADAVPELNAVVVGSPSSSGDSNTRAPQTEQVGSVLIVQAANHLQSVAVLDLYVREAVVPGTILRFADASGLELASKREELTRHIDDLHVKLAAWQRDPSVAPTDVSARRQELSALEAQLTALGTKPPPAQGSFFRFRIQEIREALGKDPSVEADLRAYYKAVNDHNREAFAGRMPPAAAPDQATYVGIDVCSGCHAAPRTVWNKTSHAGAYVALSSQLKELNLECVGCHVTGYEQPGGSTVTHVDGLKDVQCEVCHGPGSRHVASPKDPKLIKRAPDTSGCLSCHHPPHVEQFDPVAKMQEILGPGHGR